MTPMVAGAAAGTVLALAGLAFGFWGFLLTALFMGAGAVLGRAAEGRLDLAAAVKGGRMGRRSMDSDRTALVVDDEAIAAALARKVRLAGNLAPEQVATTVTRSCALANVRPTSGVPLERNVLAEAAAGEVVSLRLHKKLAVEVRVAAEGAVGR